MVLIKKEHLTNIDKILDNQLLRWKIIAILEYGVDISILLNDPLRREFEKAHSKELTKIIRGTKFDKASYPIIGNWPMSAHSYNKHFLSLAFDKLIHKSKNNNNKKQFAAIRLAESSGMTELSNKKSLKFVKEWINKLLDDNSYAELITEDIKNTLFQNWLYYDNEWEDEEDNRRIGVNISSNKKLHIIVEHDTYKTTDWYNWYYFILSSKYKKIVDIIMKIWYYKDNIWEAIEFIIEDNEENKSEDIDDFDLV